MHDFELYNPKHGLDYKIRTKSISERKIEHVRITCGGKSKSNKKLIKTKESLNKIEMGCCHLHIEYSSLPNWRISFSTLQNSHASSFFY